MNKREKLNYHRLLETLTGLGLDYEEIDSLIRCERTLTNWSVKECGDGDDWAIERDGDDGDGRPFMVYHGPGNPRRYPIADRETGALKRAAAIAERHGLTIYHQGDCRGCALYLIRPGDVPEGQDVGGYYNRGIAVCYQ